MVKFEKPSLSGLKLSGIAESLKVSRIMEKLKVSGIANAVFERRKELFIIFLIFLLGFSIRAYMLRYDWIFEFDSYWHARVISYVIQTGTFPDRDPMAYYQIGGSSLHVGSDFFWYLNAVIYWIFTFGLPYSKEVWVLFVKILPALYGALVGVAMYFLGKEVYNKKAGFLFGFFAATMPAFVYRTMGGWIEDDSFGFLPFIIALVFMARALKEENLNRKAWINVGLAGFFFGLMSWSWSGYQIAPVIVISFLGLMIVGMLVKGFKSNEIVMQVVKVVAVIALFAVLAYPIVGLKWTDTTVNTFARYLPVTPENIVNVTAANVEPGTVVGEENLGHPFFANKYNAMIVFFPIAIILMLYGLFKEKRQYLTLLLLAWIAVTFVMGWTKLKFTYYLGLSMAAVSAIAIFELVRLLEKRSIFEKRLVGLFLGLMLFVGIAAGTFFIQNNLPNIHYGEGWPEALDWLKDNTPENAKIFNWWDEGHWISFVGERAVLTDNRNWDGQANKDAAKFIITYDENEAVSIVKKYGSDYIVFGDDLLQKPSSLFGYAFSGENPDNQTRLLYQSAFAVVLNCSKSVASVTGEVTYNCGGNAFNSAQMDSIPETWVSATTPGFYFDPETKRIPGFVYKSKEKNRIYALTPSANESMIAKIWFEKDSVKDKFPIVHSVIGVKIFKINV